MLFITDVQSFIVPAIMLAAALIYVQRKRGAILLLAAASALIVNDFVGHYILKEFFARTRPCHVLDLLKNVPHCTQSFSFPSNHTSNIFTIATLASLCHKNTTLLAGVVALMIGFSRIYLGLHYPSDVLGGAFCGIVMGFLGYKFKLYLDRVFLG